MAPAPKKFAHQPLDPIPHCSIADLAADSNSQSILSVLIALTDNNEIR